MEGCPSCGSRSGAARDIITRWLPVDAVEAVANQRGAGLGGDGEGVGEAPLTITASVESEDRAGDLVLASGWDLRAYERNPVVLWAHQHLSPPIGRSLRTWVEGKSLMATVQFAPSPFAQEVRRLYEGGFLRGVSVGFRAVETEPRKSAQGRRGLLFKRQELLEISAAPVPLHADTLAMGNAAESPPGRAERRDMPDDDREAADALDGVRRLWDEIGALSGAGG